MRKVGIALVVLGIVGMILTSVSFSTEETVVDAGPLEIQKEEERTLPIPTYAAGGLILVGGVLLVVDWQQKQ
ncbi:hypothetical protein CRI94_04285 [Longibacter salinarum]|uniref:DUF3185 domain-containing protein n=1 Tax=Longibacter salinarum TaxID=1850348 RepID=A0A2A8D097_9BACT|nr:hypothetical protein [Longibacter salinarum]PEN14263.1 hypothetical protein CRI94_04285 [Longibacter salinarum]